MGEGVQPYHLNDDRLGTALDKFYTLTEPMPYPCLLLGFPVAAEPFLKNTSDSTTNLRPVGFTYIQV
jgi:hypothetical protein